MSTIITWPNHETFDWDTGRIYAIRAVPHSVASKLDSGTSHYQYHYSREMGKLFTAQVSPKMELRSDEQRAEYMALETPSYKVGFGTISAKGIGNAENLNAYKDALTQMQVVTDYLRSNPLINGTPLGDLVREREVARWDAEMRTIAEMRDKRIKDPAFTTKQAKALLQWMRERAINSRYESFTCCVVGRDGTVKDGDENISLNCEVHEVHKSTGSTWRAKYRFDRTWGSSNPAAEMIQRLTSDVSYGQSMAATKVPLFGRAEEV